MRRFGQWFKTAVGHRESLKRWRRSAAKRGSMGRRAPHWRFDDESVIWIIGARATMSVDSPESETKQRGIGVDAFFFPSTDQSSALDRAPLRKHGRPRVATILARPLAGSSRVSARWVRSRCRENREVALCRDPPPMGVCASGGCLCFGWVSVLRVGVCASGGCLCFGWVSVLRVGVCASGERMRRSRFAAIPRPWVSALSGASGCLFSFGWVSVLRVGVCASGGCLCFGWVSVLRVSVLRVLRPW